MKVNRGVVGVGDSGAVLQCTVKDIPIYLGQKVLRNRVLLKIHVLVKCDPL